MMREFRGELLTEFAGRPVNEFHFERPESLGRAFLPADVEAWAWRVAKEHRYYGSYAKTFELFLDTVDTTRVRALILGCWLGDVDELDGNIESDLVTGPLIEHAARFPALEALFVGDILAEQSEVSWIRQGDPGPILGAFPGLRVLGLRGTSHLTLAPLAHAALEELTFQGGGLPPEVARAIGGSALPSLTGLDLYLGELRYNGGSVPADYAPILEGRAFPALRHLALRDADNQDEIAAALAHSPVVAQLESLDLSLGSLTDEGAAALLAGQPLTHLKSLDLHHHYLSAAMVGRLREALPGVELDLSEQCEPDVWDDEPHRYIAVSE